MAAQYFSSPIIFLSIRFFQSFRATSRDAKHIQKVTNSIRESCKKKGKKLTSVSFMYVCVAGNGEMLVFFSFFPQQ